MRLEYLHVIQNIPLVILVCAVDIVDIVRVGSCETRERVAEWILKRPLVVDFFNFLLFSSSSSSSYSYSSSYSPASLKIIPTVHFKRIVITFLKVALHIFIFHISAVVIVVQIRSSS